MIKYSIFFSFVIIQWSSGQVVIPTPVANFKDQRHEHNDMRELEPLLDDLWRFHDPMEGDYNYEMGHDQKDRKNFKEYRFDGLVGTVVPAHSYPEAVRVCDQLVPLNIITRQDPTGGQYQSLKTGFLINKEPIAYCAPYPGYCGADQVLFSFFGHGRTFDGRLSPRELFTSTREPLDNPGAVSQLEYKGISCYIWSRSKLRYEQDEILPESIADLEIRHFFDYLKPIHAFYNQERDDHYYDDTIDNVHDFEMTLAYVIAPEAKELVQHFCPILEPIYTLNQTVKTMDGESVQDGQIFQTDALKKECQKRGGCKQVKLIGYAPQVTHDCATRLRVSVRRGVRRNGSEEIQAYREGTENVPPEYIGMHFTSW